MRIIDDVKLDFDDVLIVPKRSKMASRSLVNLEREYTTLNSKQVISSVPIIASNMDSVGTFAMAESLLPYNMLVCLHKFYPICKLQQFFSIEKNKNCFYTLGVSDNDMEKFKELLKTINFDKICIDVANGYTKYFQDRVKMIRDLCPKSIIMAGNVVTPEMVQELLISGAADIIKIGIGPGSACATRLVTGVGYPQISAVLETADAAHGLGGLICSDGGCRFPGDIAKAFAAGADFVMVGGMFAGHDECEVDWQIDSDGNKSMKFYGMSSAEAMVKYNGSVASYRASEGKCLDVPYKGPVSQTVQQILGGLRSTCTYVGASRLKDLSKCTTFVKTTGVKKQ